MKKILIGLDRIKHPNSGTGRIAIDFANELRDNDEFKFTLLVPWKKNAQLNYDKETIKLSFWRRWFPSYQSKFDAIHILHQDPDYRITAHNRLLITIHDLNFLEIKGQRIKNRYRINKLLAKTTGIGFISKYAQTDFNYKLKSSKSIKQKVIYNGVSPLAASSEKPIWCPDGKFLFSIGIFTANKNYAVLLDFIKTFPQEYQLVIAGNKHTGYGSYIEYMLDELELGNRVILPGQVTEAEKSYLFHNCEAFVFPSIGEGFGLSVIEAMSAGKPVFSSDKTSLEEIGSTYAFFWKDFDAQEMKQVFDEGMKTFDDQRKQEEMAYAKEFTWKNNVEAYLEYYREILE